MKIQLAKFKTHFIILIILIGFYFALKQPEPKPVGYTTCISNSDCISSNCINGLCRNKTTFCGDYFCDAWEDCTSCTKDCGNCKVENGEACETDWDCYSNKCVHRICRQIDPFHGDGYCDTNETCWNAPKDCGECNWI